MLKLHSLENTELSPYCLSILDKHGITLVREFFGEKNDKLMKILNLNYEQVKKIKNEFLRLYGPKPEYLVCFKENKVRKTIYGTHIENLDNMLQPHEQFSSSSFWEICGPTGVGKTQLAFTLMLNFVINQVASVLYIDTKLDFSASRVKNMLVAREIEPDLYAGILSFIKVERVLSAQGIVEMLEEFIKQLQLGNGDVKLIKMIVIDSLPAAWFLLKTDTKRLSGKWLLSRLNQNINRLVKHHCISVICINLSLIPTSDENETKPTVHPTSYNDEEVCDHIEEDDMELDCNKSSAPAATYRPVLGNFWLSKPHARFSLELPDNNDVTHKMDASLRVIKLMSTIFNQWDRSCTARLQKEGFV